MNLRRWLAEGVLDLCRFQIIACQRKQLMLQSPSSTAEDMLAAQICYRVVSCSVAKGTTAHMQLSTQPCQPDTPVSRHSHNVSFQIDCSLQASQPTANKLNQADSPHHHVQLLIQMINARLHAAKLPAEERSGAAKVQTLMVCMQHHWGWCSAYANHLLQASILLGMHCHRCVDCGHKGDEQITETL